METQQEIIKKEAMGNRVFKILGILFFLFACLSLLGAVALDVVGEKAVGKVSNAAKGCSPGRSCWTGQVDFTTQEGEEVTFHPFTAPFLFDLDPALSGRSYDDYGKYQVRYLKAFPQLAKVKLAFFMEYTTHLGGLCLGSFLLLISAAFSTSSKQRKPLVLDLSKLRGK